MGDEAARDRGFTVKDRRRFAGDGGEREATEAAKSESAPESGAAAAGQQQEASGRPGPEEITFSGFIVGLSTQALFHLGEIPDARTHAIARDLGAAKQVIDILALLEQKTRGNLDEGEQALIERVLYDLRMRYVELKRRGY